MKLTTLVLTLSLVTCAPCEKCKPSADDLVKVLETELDSYDQFIYGRYLETERMTCQRVALGMSKLRDSFDLEVSVALDETNRQIRTLVESTRDTDAGPCVTQMSRTLERFQKEENGRFQQCMNVSAAQLESLQIDLTQDMKKFSDLKARSKATIKSCLINSPGTCPSTINKCMDTQIDSFNTNAKSLTEDRLVRSPCMGKLKEVLQCFTHSVQNVFKQAKRVQHKANVCINLEDSYDTRQSILALPTNTTLNLTLDEQVNNAQKQFQNINSDMVKVLGWYYQLEKSARMTYEFRPHDYEYFKERVNEMFSGRLRAVEEVRRIKRHVWPDNKTDFCCGQAFHNFRLVKNQAISGFMRCEKDVLSKTQNHIQLIRKHLGSVSKDLAFIGDPAIIECLNGGAILAENMIEGCYDLTRRQFMLKKQTLLDEVDVLMKDLERYNNTYFQVSESTQCSDNSLLKVYLMADMIMYDLNRCPYRKDLNFIKSPSTTDTTQNYRTTYGYDEQTTEIMYYYNFTYNESTGDQDPPSTLEYSDDPIPG